MKSLIKEIEDKFEEIEESNVTANLDGGEGPIKTPHAFAKSKDEWRAALVHLIQNEEARTKLGAAGKETVRLKYSVLAYTTSFLNLFK